MVKYGIIINGFRLKAEILGWERVVYELCEKTVELEGRKIQTYGICQQGKGVEDVSSDKEFVLEILHLCNTMRLSPCQLMDVVEDCLAEHYGVW